MSDQLSEMSLWSDTLTGQVHFLIACTGEVIRSNNCHRGS